MNATQRAAALRLADAFAYELGLGYGPLNDSLREAVALLRELASEPQVNPAPGYCKHCRQYTIEEPLPAETQVEPVIAVVTISHDYGATIDWTLNPLPTGTELYANPPQQRKPLTDNEISDLILACEEENGGEACSYHDLARAVEAAHSIKETP